MTEAEIVAKSIKWLNKQPDCYAVKIVAHPRQRSGIPDVLSTICGWYVAFEFKVPGREGKTTPLQQYVIDKIKAAGGRAYVVTSDRQVKEVVNELRRRERNAKSGKKHKKRGSKGV